MKKRSIFDFEKIVMTIFWAFNPEWDTNLLKSQEQFWLRYAILVKKTWLRLLPSFITILLLVIIWWVNIFLLKYQFQGLLLSILIWIYSFNIIYTIYLFFYYLIWFKRLNKDVPKIKSIYTWIQRSEYSDTLFHNFFNQIMFNIITFIIMSIIMIVYIIYNTQNIWYSILNVGLLFFQIYQLYKIKVVVNNQEMDFLVMTPTNFYMYNMDGYNNIQDHDFWVEKIKNVKKTYWATEADRSILGSIFKFWTLIFLLEWGENTPPIFRYAPYIKRTTEQLSLFVSKIDEYNNTKQYTKVIPNIKVILPKILYELKIDINKNLKDVIENNKYFNEIKNYLLKHKKELTLEYNNGNEHIKKEIEELGKKYLK